MASQPQKRYYRQRAHSNPMSYRSLFHPINPETFDFLSYYKIKDADLRKIEFVDVGCGYGGLLSHLAIRYPDKLALGIEIRTKVSEYVIDTIKSLRQKNPGEYGNIACIRTNAMKYLPNFFGKQQLTKLFILFPDPHFKRAKHKWRFVSDTMLAEIAYILAIGGIVYTATDVYDMHTWITEHFNRHPLFESLTNIHHKEYQWLTTLPNFTQEGQKAIRENKNIYYAIFVRI